LFSIGSISSSGPLETASVNGTGILTIADGLGYNLTANLTWNDISQDGTGSTLNVNGLINLTGVMYAGSNPDLMALAANVSDSDTLDFTFDPAVSLTQMATTAEQTTYSGSISSASVPDGGETAMLLGVALCAIGICRNRLIAG